MGGNRVVIQKIGLNDISIEENSWIAKLAAKKLKADNVAIVLGKTIYLHNISKTDFLQNKRWLNHELCHINQFRQYGYLQFVIKYLIESIKQGYWLNKFEIEARNAEDL